jgi:hypothetical protein
MRGIQSRRALINDHAHVGPYLSLLTRRRVLVEDTVFKQLTYHTIQSRSKTRQRKKDKHNLAISSDDTDCINLCMLHEVPTGRVLIEHVMLDGIGIKWVSDMETMPTVIVGQSRLHSAMFHVAYRVCETAMGTIGPMHAPSKVQPRSIDERGGITSVHPMIWMRSIWKEDKS